MEPRTWSNLVLLLLLCSIGSNNHVGVLAQSDSGDEGPNVALHKPVYGHAQWSVCLVDGKYGTTISPYDKRFPIIVVDLKDVYNLTSIRVHAQNEWSFYNAGVNVSFSVYVWDKATAWPDFEVLFPWKPIGTNLMFKRKGHELTLRGPFVARYIIVMPDAEDRLVPRPGMTMGELRAFGKKIRDSYTPTPPKDDEPVINIREMRSTILKCLGKVSVSFGQVQLRPSSTRTDAAVVWHGDRIGIMASVRQKGRVVTLFGVDSDKQLTYECQYSQLFSNIAKWLNPQESSLNCLNGNETVTQGTSLLIRPNDKFDVDQIYQRIASGNNSVVIAYPKDRLNASQSMIELMNKLNLTVVPSNSTPSEVWLDSTKFIDYVDDVPVDNELQVALSSWDEFRSKKLPQFPLTEKQIQSAKFQTTLRQVLEKYHHIFAYYAPYDGNKNKITQELHTAFLNYNNLLLLQRGEDILVAPGVGASTGKMYAMLKPTNYTVQITADNEGDFFPTGAYAKPGHPVRYRVMSLVPCNLVDYAIRINPQTDNLENKTSPKRWPIVTVKQPLQLQGSIVSPFGGPVVISVPSHSNITIYLENVYRHPWFNVRDPDSVKNWDTERNKYPGIPYGMIMGDNMISMIESDVLRKMDRNTIEWSTRYYDNVVKVMHNYRGTRFEKSRMEVFVTDDEITTGPSHSGYPWMAEKPLGRLYGDIAKIQKGQHTSYTKELGNNLLVPCMIFKNGENITIFTPVVHKYLLGLDTYANGSPGSTESELAEMVQTWKSRQYQGVQLSYYTYVGRLFGPALVSNVLSRVMRTTVPLESEQQKVNFWVKKMCKKSGYDLAPFHRLWSFPIDAETAHFCSQFACIFPNDDLTEQVHDLIKAILSDYGKNCSRTEPEKVLFENDPVRGVNTTKPQSIFIIDQ